MTDIIKETTEVVQGHFPYAHLRKADDSGNLRFRARRESNSAGEFRRAHAALRKDLDKLPFSATATRLKVKTHQNWFGEITSDTNWTADIRVHVHKRHASDDIDDWEPPERPEPRKGVDADFIDEADALVKKHFPGARPLDADDGFGFKIRYRHSVDAEDLDKFALKFEEFRDEVLNMENRWYVDPWASWKARVAFFSSSRFGGAEDGEETFLLDRYTRPSSYEVTIGLSLMPYLSPEEAEEYNRREMEKGE